MQPGPDLLCLDLQEVVLHLVNSSLTGEIPPPDQTTDPGPFLTIHLYISHLYTGGSWCKTIYIAVDPAPVINHGLERVILGVQLLCSVSSSYAISDSLHTASYLALRGESFHTVSDVDLSENHALLPDERNPQRPSN